MLLTLFAVTHTMFGVLITMAVVVAVVTLLLLAAEWVRGYLTRKR